MNKPHNGYVLPYFQSNQQCGHVVMDIKRHLLCDHKVEISSGEFEDLIEKSVDSGYFERAVREKIENLMERIMLSILRNGREN